MIQDPRFDHLNIPGINYVPGIGEHDSPKVCFVGEAPGPMENAKGVPFSGKAGQIFLRLLRTNHFPMNDLYMTNIVKFMPVDQQTTRFRKPTIEEIEISTEYLAKELAIVEPQYLCLMGNSAVAGIFKEKEARVKELRGKIIDPGVKLPFYIFVTYHPSLIQYKPHMEYVISKDFDQLARYVNNQELF